MTIVLNSIIAGAIALLVPIDVFQRVFRAVLLLLVVGILVVKLKLMFV